MNETINNSNITSGGATSASIPSNYLGSSYSYTNGYCAHRLPCGYCSMRQMMCPVYSCFINWNDVTCKSVPSTNTSEAKNG